MRKDIRNLSDKERDLFLLALLKLIKTDHTDPRSFFQLARIHGLPFEEWNQEPGSGTNKKVWCAHAHEDFSSWHTVYVRLFEQELQRAAREVATEHPSVFDEVVKSLCLPYFDWADKDIETQGVPDIFLQQTVTVQGQVITNPLFSYRFPRGVDIDPGPLAGTPVQIERDSATILRGVQNYWTFRYRQESTVETGGTSDPQAFSDFYKGYGCMKAREMIQHFFAPSTSSWAATWSNHSGISNLEDVHNQMHNAIGGVPGALPGAGPARPGRTGHMTDAAVSSFDPIFFLHHCNVDRLYTLLRLAHYRPDENDPFQVPDNEFKPFLKSVDDGDYWKGSDVQETLCIKVNGNEVCYHPLGQLYPEQVHLSSDPDQLRDHVLNKYSDVREEAFQELVFPDVPRVINEVGQFTILAYLYGHFLGSTSPFGTVLPQSSCSTCTDRPAATLTMPLNSILRGLSFATIQTEFHINVYDIQTLAHGIHIEVYDIHGRVTEEGPLRKMIPSVPRIVTRNREGRKILDDELLGEDFLALSALSSWTALQASNNALRGRG